MNVVVKALVGGAQIVGRAFMEAYQNVAKGGAQNARAAATEATQRMSKKVRPMEARQILGFEETDELPDFEEVQAKFDHLFHANSPEKGNSFYLQSKVFRAHESLMAEYKRAGLHPDVAGEGEEDGAKAAEDAAPTPGEEVKEKKEEPKA